MPYGKVNEEKERGHRRNLFPGEESRRFVVTVSESMHEFCDKEGQKLRTNPQGYVLKLIRDEMDKKSLAYLRKKEGDQ